MHFLQRLQTRDAKCMLHDITFTVLNEMHGFEDLHQSQNGWWIRKISSHSFICTDVKSKSEECTKLTYLLAIICSLVCNLHTFSDFSLTNLWINDIMQLMQDVIAHPTYIYSRVCKWTKWLCCPANDCWLVSMKTYKLMCLIYMYYIQ